MNVTEHKYHFIKDIIIVMLWKNYIALNFVGHAWWGSLWGLNIAQYVTNASLPLTTIVPGLATVLPGTIMSTSSFSSSSCASCSVGVSGACTRSSSIAHVSVHLQTPSASVSWVSCQLYLDKEKFIVWNITKKLLSTSISKHKLQCGLSKDYKCQLNCCNKNIPPKFM